MDVRITNNFRDVMDFKFYGEWIGAIIYSFSTKFNQPATAYVCLRLSRRFLNIVNAKDIIYGLLEYYDFDCWISNDEKLGTTKRFQCIPMELSERIKQIYDDFTEH